ESAINLAIANARALNKSAKAQSAFIEAVQTGSFQRGQAQLPASLIDWATELANDLLETSENDSKWTMIAQESPAPWILQKRKCADGQEAVVLSSLRRGESGAEQRVGILDSAEFPAPESMSFWICGHRGHPDNNAHKKNFVALLDGDLEIFRADPPRNDTCQKIEWEIPDDLQKRPVRLRIVDGDNGGSYAWIGVTRIGGAPISIDDFSLNPRDETLPKLAQLLKLTAPVSLRDRLAEFLPESNAPPPAAAVSDEQQKALQTLIDNRIAGFNDAKPNADRGRQVFQQHCASCHQIGGEGGLIAPQLDGVGSRGLARLCEDILDPNRNVDAHFRLTDLQLTDGDALTGFILLEDGNFVRVRDLGGKAHSLTKSQIESRKTLPVSLMPPVFGELISEQQFYDLAGWLLKQ
ncbi:MAG: c-type cytochrome, partial [Verrucomicrobiota bacterium]